MNAVRKEEETIRDEVLDLSRQNKIRPLTNWLSRELDRQIERGRYVGAEKLTVVADSIVEDLRQYSANHNINTCVLGMSGGVDSALTAALFKKAGWRVIGVTLPIHQNPEETARGLEAINSLGLEAQHVDLSEAYDAMLSQMGDEELTNVDDHATRIRKGNVRARLRMITLYNLASKHQGCVASTDNFSEKFLNFFSLHGDVGDVSPIQSLTKSWEVPMISKLVGVPEKTYRATPTDGLGISAGDEAQFGATYLELDLMFMALSDAVSVVGNDLDKVEKYLSIDSDTKFVFDSLIPRMKNSMYKHYAPYELSHALEDRYSLIREVDNTLDVKKTPNPLIKMR